MTTASNAPSSQEYVQAIEVMRGFFDRSTSIFDESDGAFAPAPGTFTVAQQVAHAAQTIDWFVEGAFEDSGFSLDFESMEAAVRKVGSLDEARAWWTRAIDNAKRVIGATSYEEMQAPLPDGPVMGGVPRCGIMDAMTDHTAHHRGALTVYARLLGKVAPMPYADA